MPERTYHAVILKRRDVGESDRKLTILTQEAGVIDVTAKGARKSASRLAGSSEPLAACVMHVAEGKANAFVTQVQPVSSFPGLRADYERLSFALALTELAAAVLPHEQPLPEAFTLLVQSLKYLEAHPRPVVSLIWSELKLMDMSGFLPSFCTCVASGVPVQEANPYVSSHAGGYVVFPTVERYTDRVQTRAEVLYGLEAMTQLDEPPATLKFAEESLWVLYQFWRGIADKALPANEAVVREVRHAGS